MNLIERLQSFDSAELSDALDACGVEGALLGIKPVTSGIKLIGQAYTVDYQPYDQKPAVFKSAGDYIDNVPSGSVIIINNQGREDCTTWGDILTQVALVKNIAGTVVNGAVRDVNLIRELKYPLFSRSIYMRSGKNRVYKAAEQCTLIINGVSIHPGDVIFGDDNGVLVIPLHLLDDVIQKSHNIKVTEQKIIASVTAGMTLEAARKLHRYDKPWLVEIEK